MDEESTDLFLDEEVESVVDEAYVQIVRIYGS